MNPNHAKVVKEEIERQLRVGFTYLVEKETWISPTVILPKKNNKIMVCVDYRKLNVAMITDSFLFLFTDPLLCEVADKVIYTFMNEFSGYNEVKMALEDREKTSFLN